MKFRSNTDQLQHELLRLRLENLIYTNHPLVKFGHGIDCEVFDLQFGKHYAANVAGMPACPSLAHA